MNTLSSIINSVMLCFIAMLVPLQSIAQLSSSRTDAPIKIPRITSPVKLDGLSDEPAWEEIKPLPIRMRRPNFDSEPTQRTEIRIGYDDNYFYAAGRFYDSEPDRIQTISLERDKGWTWATDAMGIIIDTFNDNENALIFVTTPEGTRTDLSVQNDAESGTNKSWNTFWDAKTVQNQKGWFAEVRIPFSSLRFEENEGQTVMGLTAYRLIARTNEIDIFPLIPEKFGAMGMLKPSQAQKIILMDINNHNPLYITPYLLGGSGQTNILNSSKTAYESKKEIARGRAGCKIWADGIFRLLGNDYLTL